MAFSSRLVVQQRRRRWFLLAEAVVLIMLALFLLDNVATAEEEITSTTTKPSKEEEEGKSDDDEKQPLRIVSKEELQSHNGKDSTDKSLWLAIMGEVYDVTKGDEYYGEGGPYSIFVGRDGSVPFITGKFDEEEAAKPLSVLDGEQLMALDDWRGFYEKEDRYPFVGLLHGDYYDEDGNPTEQLLAAKAQAKEAKLEHDKKREESLKKAQKRREQKAREALERKRQKKLDEAQSRRQQQRGDDL